MNITRGKIATALKCCIYGPEGIGKSTFASKFPNPLYIDTEGSTKHMDVARLPIPTSYSMLIAQIHYVRDNPTICQTLVLDTADWAEMMCANDLCARNNWKSIEDPGYGKGYTYLAEEFGRMLNALEEVVQKGVHVVLTAHATMRKFEQPDELGAYDRWELKLQKKTAPMVKEWADIVLFANYKTVSVKTSSGSNKAQGGKRTMFTSHHPCWDAKNRQGLPEEMDFDFAGLAHLFTAPTNQPQVQPNTPTMQTPPPVEPQQLNLNDNVEPQIHTSAPQVKESDYEGLPQALIDLMKKDHISEELIRKAVHKKIGNYPPDMPVKNFENDFIQGVLIGAWDQIVSYINANLMPF